VSAHNDIILPSKKKCGENKLKMSKYNKSRLALRVWNRDAEQQEQHEVTYGYFKEKLLREATQRTNEAVRDLFTVFSSSTSVGTFPQKPLRPAAQPHLASKMVVSEGVRQ